MVLRKVRRCDVITNWLSSLYVFVNSVLSSYMIPVKGGRFTTNIHWNARKTTRSPATDSSDSWGHSVQKMFHKQLSTIKVLKFEMGT